MRKNERITGIERKERRRIWSCIARRETQKVVAEEKNECGECAENMNANYVNFNFLIGGGFKVIDGMEHTLI